MNLQKGSTVFVREQSGKRTIARAATVIEVVGRGAYVEFANNVTRMVMWSKLGSSENGPWGKKAFLNGKKKKFILTEPAPATPSVPAAKWDKLSASEKLAADKVGKVIKLDDKGGAYVLITPDMANRWLVTSKEKNIRSIRPPTVERYQRSMEAGNWSSRTGTAIMFDKDGVMVNGQHRMWAIVLSDMSIELYVLFGVTQEEKMYGVDNGDGRSPAICLQVPAKHIAIINSIRRHATGNRDKRRIGNDELHVFVEHYKDLLEWFDNIPSTPQGRRATRSSDIASVIIRARENGEDEDMLTAFIQILRRDPVTVEVEFSSEQVFMVDKLAHFLIAKPHGGGGEAVKDERVSKVEWVLTRFLKGLPFQKIISNQEKIWPSPLVDGSATGRAAPSGHSVR